MPASAHPFALLLSPKEVCDAVARSERLSGLRRRVCRPLDKPMMIPLRSPAALRCRRSSASATETASRGALPLLASSASSS
jgi:hypothetical protein